MPPPKDATVAHRNGTKIAPIRGNVAGFERDGRTCVLAGHVRRTATLITLAAAH